MTYRFITSKKWLQELHETRRSCHFQASPVPTHPYSTNRLAHPVHSGWHAHWLSNDDDAVASEDDSWQLLCGATALTERGKDRESEKGWSIKSDSAAIVKRSVYDSLFFCSLSTSFHCSSLHILRLSSLFHQSHKASEQGARFIFIHHREHVRKGKQMTFLANNQLNATTRVKLEEVLKKKFFYAPAFSIYGGEYGTSRVESSRIESSQTEKGVADCRPE